MIPNFSTTVNNIELGYIKTSKFKTQTLSLTLTVPLSKRAYLLNMLLAGIMRRGTTKYPSLSLLNKRLDELYASNVDINSISLANTLSLNVSSDLICNDYVLDDTDVLGGVLEVMRDLILSPLTDDNGIILEKSLSSEITLLRDMLSAEKNNTRTYAATRTKELLHRDDDLFPTLEYLLENIHTVSASELTEFYHALIKSASINVFYTGDIDKLQLEHKLSDIFGDLIGNERIIATGMSIPARRLCEVSEDMPVSQGKLCMGFTTGTGFSKGNMHVAMMLNELLGASPASKLFLNVREKLGLCYYCSSSYSPVSGNLTISSGIDCANKDKAIREIFAQLDALRSGDISDGELLAARRSIEYSYEQIYDSPFSLQNFYTLRASFGVDESVEECKQKLLAVTREQVSELAQKIVFDCLYFINATNKDEDSEVTENE